MALSQKERQQVLMLVIALAIGAIIAYWMLYRAGQTQQANSLRSERDSMIRQVAAARRDLQSGSIADLRTRVAAYERSVGLMRQLVPGQNEVPSLIDDIAARAGLRGVHIKSFDPQNPEPGPIFDTYRYRFSVLGHYDEIGEFLADVASLPRIMVAYDIALGPAQLADAQARADTTGALLEVQFQLRTFVKPQAGGASDGF